MRSAVLCGAGLAIAITTSGDAQGGTPPPGRAVNANYLASIDFAATPVGDFPSSLTMVDGVMDVVTINGQHMLRASAASAFLLRLPQALPADFTIEADFIPKVGANPADIGFEGTPTINQGSASANILWHSTSLQIIGGSTDNFETRFPDAITTATQGALTRVTVVLLGSTIKVFTNGRLMSTLPNRKFVRGPVLRVYLGGQDDATQAVYLAGLRIIPGALSATQVALASTPLPSAPGSSVVPNATSPGAAPTAGTAITTIAPTPATGMTTTGTSGTSTAGTAITTIAPTPATGMTTTGTSGTSTTGTAVTTIAPTPATGMTSSGTSGTSTAPTAVTTIAPTATGMTSSGTSGTATAPTAITTIAPTTNTATTGTTPPASTSSTPSTGPASRTGTTTTKTYAGPTALTTKILMEDASGWGMLLTWPPVANATGYRVNRVRKTLNLMTGAYTSDPPIVATVTDVSGYLGIPATVAVVDPYIIPNQFYDYWVEALLPGGITSAPSPTASRNIGNWRLDPSTVPNATPIQASVGPTKTTTIPGQLGAGGPQQGSDVTWTWNVPGLVLFYETSYEITTRLGTFYERFTVPTGLPPKPPSLTLGVPSGMTVTFCVSFYALLPPQNTLPAEAMCLTTSVP